jgi:hypothetical protein
VTLDQGGCLWGKCLYNSIGAARVRVSAQHRELETFGSRSTLALFRPRIIGASDTTLAGLGFRGLLFLFFFKDTRYVNGRASPVGMSLILFERIFS